MFVKEDNPYLLSEYQFDFPKELIAQAPLKQRELARLMLVEKKTGRIEHLRVGDLPSLLNSGDTLVFNDSKVIPARLKGKRESGGAVEILLLRLNEKDEQRLYWEVLSRPAKKIRVGDTLHFNEQFSCQVLEDLGEGKKKVAFAFENFWEQVFAWGEIPLPPYIQRSARETDKKDYQTVFAKEPGSVAAPTAGLHFTEGLLGQLRAQGVLEAHVTLNIGLGTFKPIVSEDIRDHKMHQELFSISEENVRKIESRPSRLIAVGTTSARALESAANEQGQLAPQMSETGIFIYPGYRFKKVEHLMTNFHLPGSSLLLLVSALAGKDLMREAYAKAIEERYRFFSYGDAMLIL